MPDYRLHSATSNIADIWDFRNKRPVSRVTRKKTANLTISQKRSAWLLDAVLSR